MGLFKNACCPAKTDPPERDLVFSLSPPPPRPEKPSTTYPKLLPLKTSSSPMSWPRGRFPGQTLSTNQLHRPSRGFVTGTNKQPRVCTVKNTHLKSPWFRVGNDQIISHTKHNPTCVHSMVQDYPLIRPSPGSTRPSNSLSPHWCEEVYPKTESLQVLFFSF
jgi:hypothetical protein